MNDIKDYPSGSGVESRDVGISYFHRRNRIDTSKKIQDNCLETFNDSTKMPKVDICLRIKPQTINNPPYEFEAITILSDNRVACNNDNAREDVTEYTFSRVFGPNVNQKAFFNSWIYDKVSQFLNGNNELMFLCGTSQSNKMNTIYGNFNDPGLIPRTLGLVFNSLKTKLVSQCKYRPDMTVYVLDKKLAECENIVQNKVLNNWFDERTQDDFESNLFEIEESQTTSTNIRQMFDSLKNEKVSLDQSEVSYGVWITYSEIYNESVYDLLVTYPANQKRTPLKFTYEENNNIYYLKDLTHISVQSAEEALKVISFGKNNLSIASNDLNKSTNRSHCIISLKLMRIENIENPQNAIISSISFCDLANSERLKKTRNSGDDLIESNHINTSLLVLNKCFSILRENQKCGERQLVVPYRESKLTQMFQTEFTGFNKTGIAMIVNVDTSPNLLEETKQLLLTSAITHKIIKAKTKAFPEPSSSLLSLNNSRSLAQSKFDLDTINESEENNVSDRENQSLMAFKDFKNIFTDEKALIRKKLVSQFSAILNENVTNQKNQRETIIKNKMNQFENTIDQLEKFYLEEIKEKDEQLAKFNANHNITNNTDSKIENYEFQINELEIEKEELLAEIIMLKNERSLPQETTNVKKQNNEGYQAMFNTDTAETEHMEADLDELGDRFKFVHEKLNKKNLEIKRLIISSESKDNIIANMDKLLNKAVEQQTNNMKLIDKKSKLIIDLENTMNKLKIKKKKYKEECLNLANNVRMLRQQYKNMSKAYQSSGSQISHLLTKIEDKKSKVAKLQVYIMKLENELNECRHKSRKLQIKINDLMTTSENLDMMNATILMDSNIQLAKSTPEIQEKYNPRSLNSKKPEELETGIPDTCDELLDEAIDHIHTRTHKRQ